MTAGRRHVPVMLAEVVAALEPAPGKLIVDGTFGAGGYSRAFLDAGAAVIGVDRDPEAIAGAGDLARASGGRLTLVNDRFSNLDRIAPSAGVDGVALDVGVSSMQLDQAARGFSFQSEGPLDMRMGAAGPSAGEIVNGMAAQDLALVLRAYGEERHAGRLARAIERRRGERPIETTADLAALVEAVLGRRPGDRIHPATRTFQALRIFVNDELGELQAALVAAERVLKPGGRLAVVTFHSLEDRLVKTFLRERGEAAQPSRHLPPQQAAPATFVPLARSAVRPGDEETERNPRARSARLRAAQRTTEPARQAEREASGDRLRALSKEWGTAC